MLQTLSTIAIIAMRFRGATLAEVSAATGLGRAEVRICEMRPLTIVKLRWMQANPTGTREEFFALLRGVSLGAITPSSRSRVSPIDTDLLRK